MGVIRVTHREMRKILIEPRYLIILFAGIVFSFIFFATITKEGQPTRLPVGVVDMDGTFLSRRMCHEINATQGVSVHAVYDNHSEARKAMQRGEIYAFYEIPQGTYNDLLQFRAPHFVLYVNSAYMLAGTLSYKQLATMGMLAGGAVQREVLRKKGYGEDQIMGLIQPIEFDTRTIGNPWINYGDYLMTTLIPALIAFLAIMHTAYSIARERQKKTMKSWFRHAEGNKLFALIGKMLPYTAFYTILCLIANLIMFGFMGFNFEGSWLMMMINTILLISASQCAGAFIACCIPEPPLSMGVSAIYSAISFSLSGFSFPVDSMPAIIYGASWIYPIRHYFLNFCDIAIFGNGFAYCWPRFCAMMLFFTLPIFGAFMLNWQEQKQKKHVKPSTANLTPSQHSDSRLESNTDAL